jgi:carboxylate-amine ligase
MTDACPRLGDTLLLARLFRVLVAFAISRPDPGARYDATARWLLAENRWQAKRHGSRGRFVTDAQSGVISAAQWLEQARSMLAKTAECIGEQRIFDDAEALLDAGNSASRQLVCHARAMNQGADPQQSIYQVVDHLLLESRS